jgi:hypothetical protein
MSTTALALASVSLLIGSVALCVAIYQAVLNRRRYRREAGAEVICEEVRVYENPNAPAGWQTTVRLRNVGGATAFSPALWISDRSGSALTSRYDERGGTLAPGEGGKLSADLPAAPTDGSMCVWICWEDGAGPHERDTGKRI